MNNEGPALFHSALTSMRIPRGRLDRGRFGAAIAAVPELCPHSAKRLRMPFCWHYPGLGRVTSVRVYHCTMTCALAGDRPSPRPRPRDRQRHLKVALAAMWRAAQGPLLVFSLVSLPLFHSLLFCHTQSLGASPVLLEHPFHSSAPAASS